MPASSLVLCHYTSRRFRLKVPPEQRTPERMSELRQKLAATPGVTSTEVNAATGSILVHHEGRSAFADLLDSAGLSEDVLLAALPPRLRGAAQNEASHVASQLTGRFLTADARLARATGGWLDLKMAIPLGLLSAAAWRAAAEGTALLEIPPYILLWYAFDSFIKLHQPTLQETAAGDRSDSPTRRLPEEEIAP